MKAQLCIIIVRQVSRQMYEWNAIEVLKKYQVGITKDSKKRKFIF
jgi:hypothetical protein